MAVARLGGGNSFASYWLKLVILGTIRFWWKFRLTSLEPMFCNTPKYTLVVFDMFRVFCKCKFDYFISEMRNREMRDPESYKT